MVTGLCLLQFIGSGSGSFSSDEYWQKVVLRLPLLFLPVLMLNCINENQFKVMLLLLAVPLAWLSGAGLLNYLNHAGFYNQMVLESKPIPVYSQIYHIEYSVLQALTGLVLIIFLWVTRKSGISDNLRVVLIVCTAIIVLSLHVFSARTGILAFWTGIFAWAFVKVKKGAGSKVLLILGLLLTGVVLSIPSARNRLMNTGADIESVISGKDLNDKSFGQRWIAWKVSIEAIKNRPFTGYGIQNVRKALTSHYEEENYGLKLFNRVNPHNQYLEIALQNGLFALLLLILTLALAVKYAVKTKNSFLLVIIIAIAAAMMFESILERQAGVLFVFTFVSIALSVQGNSANSFEKSEIGFNNSQ